MFTSSTALMLAAILIMSMAAVTTVVVDGQQQQSASNATVPGSSNTVVALDNATLSNETITKLANETITKLANETIIPLTNNLTQALTAINQSATNQARINEEIRRNASEEIAQTLNAVNQSATNQARLNEDARGNATAAITGPYEAFPTNMSIMLGLSIVLVFAVPVIIDLRKDRKDRSRDERSDLYRALMTFGVIIVVGLVIIYLIGLINFNISQTNSNVDGLIDVLKNLSTIVGTALAAIVAFYFGAKSVQERERREAEEGERRP
jgi:Sec-independent protein secretion pathway component TatC